MSLVRFAFASNTAWIPPVSFHTVPGSFKM